MLVVPKPADLPNHIGADLGETEWLEISQERINTFADATGDHQWIHVDVEKAKEGPFGAPIAHGYLTASLANLFLPQLLEVQNTSMGVNYGCDKIRFPLARPGRIEDPRHGGRHERRGDQGRRLPGQGHDRDSDRGQRPAGLHHRDDQPLLSVVGPARRG